MKTLLLISSIAVLTIPGWAAPCAPGTLASYIAMGTAGCTLGNVQVAGFSYQAQARGGAAEITADQIKVTPELAPTGTFGLQFTAPWGVQSGQAQLSGITYRAVSATASIQIQQVRLDGSGFEAGLFGSVMVDQTMATPAATRELQIYLKCSEVCRSQTDAQLAITPGVSMLLVMDRATLQSRQGSVSMTGFTDWLVTCIACV